MQAQGVRAHVTPVIFQPEVTFTAGCRAESHAPSGGNGEIFRPQAVLLFVVNQYAADGVFIIKRVKAFHRGLPRPHGNGPDAASAATDLAVRRSPGGSAVHAHRLP